MIKERHLESNPYLKARGDSQLRAKHAFERQAGWSYGLFVGVLLLLFVYGWDAVQLAQLHAEYWWVRFALACVTIFPLAILAGGISGYVNWVLKLLTWVLFGIASAWCAIHIPFEGARLALQWFDANLRVVEFLPIPAAAADSFGMLATLAAFLGILVGLVQTIAINWAWERSTDDYHLTWRGAVSFLFAVPVVLGFAVLFDGTAQMPLRAPLQLIQSVIQSGLQDAPGLDTSQMELHRALVYITGQHWRAQFTPDYTIHLASSEPNLVGESFVDVTFANGFNWRCRVTTFGEFTGSCYDLNSEYRNFISSFANHGAFDCTDCQAQIAPAAAVWQNRNARPLTAADSLSVHHGAGSSVIVRVESQIGNGFQCLVWGANPVVIQACK